MDSPIKISVFKIDCRGFPRLLPQLAHSMVTWGRMLLVIPVKDELVHGAGCCGHGEKKQEKVTTVKISPFCRPTRSIDGPKISSHRARKEIMNRRIKGEEEGSESLSRTHHLFVIAYLCTCEGRRRIKGRKKMARGERCAKNTTSTSSRTAACFAFLALSVALVVALWAAA